MEIPSIMEEIKFSFHLFFFMDRKSIGNLQILKFKVASTVAPKFQILMDFSWVIFFLFNLNFKINEICWKIFGAGSRKILPMDLLTDCCLHQYISFFFHIFLFFVSNFIESFNRYTSVDKSVKNLRVSSGMQLNNYIV